MDVAELESRIAARRAAIAELERVVYARPAADADPDKLGDAASELARLQDVQQNDELILRESLNATRAQEVQLPRSDRLEDRPATTHRDTEPEPQYRSALLRSVLTRWRFLVVAGVIAAVALTGYLVTSARGDAVDVFDREQTPAEAEAEEAMGRRDVDVGSVRLLGVHDQWSVYAYTRTGSTCLHFADTDFGAGTCTPNRVFADSGITTSVLNEYFDEQEGVWKHVTFSWGLKDDLRVTETIVEGP